MGWRTIHPALFWTLALCPLPASAQWSGPTRVVVAEARQTEVRQTVQLVASVEPVVRSLLGTEVEGLVVEVPVREGDAVHQGDLLCRLDGVFLEQTYHEQLGRLENLKARLAELEAGTRPEEIDRLQAAVEEAKANLELWQFEKDRVTRLYETRAASDKEYRDVISRYNIAVKQLAQAKAQLALARAGERREVIEQARAMVRAQQAVVARAKDQFEKTRIVAPFDGVITRRDVEVGQWLPRGGSVIELINLDTVLVRTDVPESAITYATVGQPAVIDVPALNRRFRGTIRHVIPQADPNARTFPVKIAVPNPDGVLLSGMFALATIPSGPAEPSVVVPKDAVVLRDGVPTIVVVREIAGSLKGVPLAISTGAEQGEWVAVTSGNVAPGMRIVVQGNESILFPTDVEIVATRGPEASARPRPESSSPPADAPTHPG